MSAPPVLARSALALVLLLTSASGAAAQEQAALEDGVAAAALVVAVRGVLDRLHQQGSVPAEPRLVVTPYGPGVPGGAEPMANDAAQVEYRDALAEQLGARVATLEEVRQCPSGAGPCTLLEADAVISSGPLQATGSRATVAVVVTYAVPRIAHDPVRSAAYQVDLSRLGSGWTVTSMGPITTP